MGQEIVDSKFLCQLLSLLTKFAGSINSNKLEKTKRERFSLASLHLLFKIVSQEHVKGQILERIAHFAAPILLNHCKAKIDLYVRDRSIDKATPMSRTRNVELLSILDNLMQLKLHKGCITVSYSDKNSQNPTLDHLSNHDFTHLFMMYKQFCDLLAVVSGSEWASMISSSNPCFKDDAHLTELVKECLIRIGEIFEPLSQL
jgi:hypothetical protein